ncbi:MAG: cupin fold metalloprotein, WbuC family [Planctomycetia bacterium]|nr:cupin fold metalloprotein, WbuC family [Planctomycetia bacterium]
MSFGSSYGVVSSQEMKRLVANARKSPLRRSRIILHDDHTVPVQAMIICLLRGSKVGLHKHPPGKPEYYLIIEGTLRITVKESDKNKFFLISNESGKEKFFYTKGSIWHEPEAITEYATYFEVYQGPFLKQDDVIYFAGE